MSLKSQRGPNFVCITTDDETVGSVQVGAAGDRVALYGADPVAQPASAVQAAPVAYVTGAFGLDSDVNAEALYDLVVEMRNVLVNAGLMKGSA